MDSQIVNSYSNYDLETLKQISYDIGIRKELIQGAGGNTSYKIGNTLWIKASGTRLENAQKDSIFIPLKLQEVIRSIELEIDNNKNYKPLINTKLRASIETGFHAILPYKYVLHTHPIDVISQSIVNNAKESIGKALKGIDWTWISYEKPGYKLARSIYLNNKKFANAVYILENHGLIICANNGDEALKLQEEVINRLRLKPREKSKPDIDTLIKICHQFKSIGIDAFLPADIVTHSLPIDKISRDLLKKNPLYPDHLVFCGFRPLIVNKNDIHKFTKAEYLKYNYCIIEEIGVILFRNPSSSSAEIMLQTQSLIHLRIPINKSIKALNDFECSELINWEAESYRIKLNKKG